MGKAKLVLGVVLAVVIGIVVLVVVINGDGDTPAGCGTPSSPAAKGGVPEGQFSKPVLPSTVVNSSGYRTPDRPDHRGIDLAGPVGTPIYAFADGVVAQAGPADGFGNWIVLDHQIDGKLTSTVYGHMFTDGVLVHTGETVKAGQHIGNIGNAGGSTGPHLHFEVWPGGRLAGGSDTDPTPWYDKAVDPGTSGGGSAPASSASSAPATPPGSAPPAGSPSSPPGPSTPAPPGAASDEEMPESKVLVNQEHLQIDTIRVARAVSLRFPEIKTIGGWRPYDRYDDHPSGRADDIMIPEWDTDKGRELGNRIKNYLYANREYFHIEYMIWRKVYIPSDSPESPYTAGAGDPTTDHYDHVHVTTTGHGFPAADQKYGGAPTGGDNDSSESTASGTPVAGGTSGCAPGNADAGRPLADAEIPEELRKWVKLGGQVCREVDSPLLAGLLYHESNGFNAHAVSPVGAQGYGQFMPDTWAGAGAKVDDNGKIAGPPGSGSPSDPADASMAAARYLCDIAHNQAPKIASGQIKGDPRSLMLAGYNAGEGNVDQFGGVPPFTETQKYVVLVPEAAQKFVGKT